MTTTPPPPRNLFDVEFCALDQSALAEYQDLYGVALLPQLKATDKNLKVYAVRIAKLLAEKSKTLRASVRRNLGLRRARDLVHAICALYDNCLPELGVSNVYDCICDHKALTIFVVEATNAGYEPSECGDSVYGQGDCLSEVEKTVPEAVSVFKELFTDQEEEEEDEDEEEEDDGKDQTQGVQSFIDNVKSQSEPSSLAFLKGLVACCTIRKVTTFSLSNKIESVIDLELLCVRKKYRRQKIGKYLIDLVKNRYCVGVYDAIVTSSDFEAIKFYENADFSLDPILNSKYGSIGDVWTNTTRMCYLPTYQGTAPVSSDSISELSYMTEVEAMEKDFIDWQKSVYNTYQSQVQMFTRLKKDLLKTKASLLVKDRLIEELKIENDLLKRKMKFLELRDSLLSEP